MERATSINQLLSAMEHMTCRNNALNGMDKTYYAIGMRKPKGKRGSWSGCVVTFDIHKSGKHWKYYSAVFDENIDFVPDEELTCKDVYDGLISESKSNGWIEPMTEEDIRETCGIKDGVINIVDIDYFKNKLS